MKIALLAPSPVPFVLGGAENLWQGLLLALNRQPGIEADLIKIPSPERDFGEIINSYKTFANLDLRHFDRIISTKYPAWMTNHPDHTVYLQHKLRGLYDTWPVRLDTALPRDLPAPLRALLESASTDHAQLPELFANLENLLATREKHPPAWFSLPGPLIRTIVHKLDAIALAPGRIRRYAAISATVAARSDYFPPGVHVEVRHHPTGLTGLHNATGVNIFTASRLDAPKRIDLLLRAYLRAGVRMPLRIAGSGPQEAALRALAGSNPQVHFLGRITDAQLIDEYANAAFVPFIPHQEDYGLITVEAMQAAKPVVTVTDAGGVTELVQDGHNGLIVPPDETRLAEAIRRLADDPVATAAMGREAADSVAGLNWDNLATWLATDPALGVRPGAKRPRVLVANTFAIHPPMSGGQLRLYHLYRNLARWADVVIVNLVPGFEPALAQMLAPGFTEIRVPQSYDHQQATYRLANRLDASVDDLSAMLDYRLTPVWLDNLRHEASSADIIIASHPYTWPALRAVTAKPIHYEAHNVEADLKQGIIGQHLEHLEKVRQIEGDCARMAPRVFACSEQDAARLCECYGLAAEQVSVIANGVDMTMARRVGAAERQRLRRRLGIGKRYLGIFIGSLHGPNIEAACHILDIARAVPSAEFVILGSVCRARDLQRAPSNVHLAGIVSEAEKQIWFAAADVALNPVTSGSGTNLKLLDYAAAGLPILSTPFGARGGILSPDHYRVADIANFPAALAALRALPAAERDALVEAAWQRVRDAADWPVIAATLYRTLFTHTDAAQTA